MTNKKLKIDIFATKIDGNAFAIMAKFKVQARKEGWTKEEIDHVINECMSDDYDHLLQTIMKHTV